MNAYDSLTLASSPAKRWLVTGAAGFIGSHLVESLLRNGQQVIGIDNFSGGFQRNLDEVQRLVGPDRWQAFSFSLADIEDVEDCRRACDGVDIVLHQAALCSVPASIEDPLRTHSTNVGGFMNMLIAARDARVKRFVYATSSAVYGEQVSLPISEGASVLPGSPYAASKLINEIYAGMFTRVFGLDCIGLRYFNVFGSRQDPANAYAAVIPKWITQMIRSELVYIHGDGQNTRDFCLVEEIVQANLLAGTSTRLGAQNQVFNIAGGEATSLNELFQLVRAGLAAHFPYVLACEPLHDANRLGDIRHSVADISKAKRLLDYRPLHKLANGLTEAIAWYALQLGGRSG